MGGSRHHGNIEDGDPRGDILWGKMTVSRALEYTGGASQGPHAREEARTGEVASVHDVGVQSGCCASWVPERLPSVPWAGILSILTSELF